MRLPHCVAFFNYLPWFVDGYGKKLLLPKRNAMRKMHVETGCGNSALPTSFLYEKTEW